MMKIEDIIVKSLIAVESPIAATCRMFQPYRSNCFELYGYDIIVDENLRPWLLEVNLSPSLSCDSPLDFKIKSHMLSDMFSLIGISCEDPSFNNSNQPFSASKMKSSLHQSCSSIESKSKQGNNQNISIRRPTAGLRHRTMSSNIVSLKSDQLRMVKRFKEEYRRKGGWIRIFPTIESLETYFPLFVSNNFEQNNSNVLCGPNQVNLNKMLYFKLFPNHELESEMLSRTNAQNLSNFKSRISLHSINYNSSFHNGILGQLFPSSQLTYKRVLQNYTDTNSRIPYYERRLGEDATVMENFPKKISSETKIKNKIPQADLNEMSQDSDNEMVDSSSSFSTSDKEDPENSDLDADVEDEEETSTHSHNNPVSLSQSCKDIPIDQIIQHGGKLTKIQARMAFSCYLTRVQQRLLIESRSEESGYVTSSGTDDSNNQLELILRFLKRAALNISSEKFIIPAVPERSQSLSQRQEWLAKLLGSFIRLYSQETSIGDINQTDTTTSIDKKTFLSFLRLASESELEQTLSNYTRVNKSAGIFLNLNSQFQNVSILTDSKKSSFSEFGLRKSSSMKNLSKPYVENNRKPLQQSQQTVSKSITQSSFQLNKDNSVSKPATVDQQQLLSRPTSVNQISRPGSTRLTINTCRPISTNMVNSRSSKTSNKTENAYDPEAISKALQRLALDQKNRHLTASVFPFYDSNFDQQISIKNSVNIDPLTQTLMRQYQQSRQLLQESRAKHSALLKQTSTRNSEVSTTSNKVQLVNKPPPGIRSTASTNPYVH